FTLSIWLIFGFGLHAAASVGAVIGFDGEEHIFIQPYWRGAKLRCVIANLRNEPAKISVHLEGPENTAGKQIQKAWVLAAHCVQDVDGSKLDQAKGLLWIRLNDQFDLGTLPIGKAPDLETKDAIVTTYGLNGSTDWVWASQNDLRFKAGSVFELRVLVKYPSGVFQLKKAKNRLEPGERISEIFAVEAVYPRGKIEHTAKQIAVQLPTLPMQEKRHVITLRFKAPLVGKSTLMYVNGRF